LIFEAVVLVLILSTLLQNGIFLIPIFAVFLLLGRALIGWVRNRMIWDKTDRQFSFQQIKLSRKSAPRLQPYLNELLYFIREPENFPQSRWLIMGTHGSGKTHALLRTLSKATFSLSRPKLNVQILSAHFGAIPEVVENYADPSSVCLMIDGLDETPGFYRNPVREMDRWISATQHFGGVVFTLNPEHWPELLSLKGSSWRFVGQETSVLFATRTLPAPSAPQSYPKAGLSAFRGLAEENTAFERLRKGEEIWESISRNVSELDWKEMVLTFARHTQQSNRVALPIEIFLEIGFGSEPDKSPLKKVSDLFWVDSEQAVHPIHPALLTLAALSRKNSFRPEEWRLLMDSFPGLDRLLQTERTRELARDLGETVQVQLGSSADFCSLESLSYAEILEVKHIEFSLLPLSEDAWQVISLLKKLAGIYLPPITDNIPPNGLIKALPNEQIPVYIAREHKGWTALTYQSEEVDLWQGEESLGINVSASIMAPLQLEDLFAPELPRKNPWNRPKKAGIPDFESRMLEKLIEGNLPYLGDEQFHTIRLPQAFMGLFHHATLYRLPNQTYTLAFKQAYDSTLLVQEVNELLNLLSRHMGEDDKGNSILQVEDEVGLQKGFWMGRQWLWERTDRYPFPIHLYMQEPQQLSLVLWNLALPTKPVEEGAPQARLEEK